MSAKRARTDGSIGRWVGKKGSTSTGTTRSTTGTYNGYVDDQDDITWTEEEEKRLVRKLDWCLLPTVWLMALMSWMDRSSIGNAQVAGMGEDLELTSSQYSMVIVIFYFGYVTFGPLSNLILSRTLPRLYLPFLVLSWGILTSAMALVKNYPQLLAIRLFIGVFESGLSPATIFLISCWYRPNEQGKRISTTLSAALLGGAFGGLIAGGVATTLDGFDGISGWRWLFIVEGIVTIAWAVISVFTMVDFPKSESSRRRFGDRGRAIAVGRAKRAGILLGGERQGVDGRIEIVGNEKRLGKIRAMGVALSDWRVWAITTAVGLLGCSTVLAYFYPILINDMGYHNPQTSQFLTIPIWAAACLCAVGSGIAADRLTHHRALMVATWMAISAVFTIVVCIVYNPVARYVLLVFMAGGVWSSIALYLALLTATFGDMNPEARAFAMSLPGSIGNLGNVYGAYLFPWCDKPRYLMGFGIIAGTLGAGGILFLTIHLLLRKRRFASMEN
ncbi:Major facilitator superfamily domain containing protein [Naviculisporaceae sp. PSN 640]